MENRELRSNLSSLQSTKIRGTACIGCSSFYDFAFVRSYKFSMYEIGMYSDLIIYKWRDK
ncbi:hypothetical protein KDA_24210 [Dictyobacter alpinus]|uniref:Uncharacterized protein n=1 Tax=Dictyobacter alpinus TaxID=2014873 RepID=A0A402B6J2_9CHLR|nr:hypothetical protein KDA_24210 [Dictyobacter alpinus]